MNDDQKRKILKAAAKACGIKGYYVTDEIGIKHVVGQPGSFKPRYFNPLTNSADTASICARLDINTFFWPDNEVDCSTEEAGHVVKHDGTPEGKEAAWRLAATMVAAKTGGLAE